MSQNQDQLRAFLDSAFDAYVAFDRDGRVVAWNSKAPEMFGWSPGTAPGEPLGDPLLAAAQREALIQEFERLRAEGSGMPPRRLESQAQRRDGGEFPTEITLWLEAPADGGYRFHALIRDIGDRHRAEQAQALLAAIVASSEDAIISKTLQGIITSWNRGAQQLFGYTAEEAIGQPVLMLIPPDKSHEEAMILSRLARGERIAHYETVRRTKDGRLIDISLSISPLRDAQGRITGASKIARNITERRRAEQALLDESRRLELLNRTGMTLSSKLDLQSLLQAVTDAATELSGAQFGAFFYNTVDANGESYLLHTLAGAPREAFAGFGQPRATALFGPTFRGEGTIRIADVQQDPRYGQWSPYHGMPPGHLPVRSYLAVPVIARSGEVIGGLFFGHSQTGVFDERAERLVEGVAAQAAISIDNARLYELATKAVAERERLLHSERSARAEAERLSAMKDEFLATLSHELRTPLSAILGWSQVLRRGFKSADDLDKALETIERNARAQTQLIEDLLDMSRITSGKVRLDIQPVMPMSFIEGAIAAVQPAADAKSIRLETILDPLAGPVSGDPNRLQQVLWNLLSNAIKFTPKGGRVQILLERVNSHIEISVADNGIGISPDFLPQVFDRFRQADASTTRRHGGLGLGLSIVKHLVELHGGTVRAKSAGEGRGATFAVHLPLAIVHRHGSETERLHPKTPKAVPFGLRASDLGGMRVLVVDDEADARELIKRLLEDCGAAVTAAGNADEALAALQATQPHVLISDIGMPGVDGYELLRRIRELGDHGGGMLPAIALTAFARSEDRTRALLAGFLAHVAKPVEPSELAATVASVAGHRKL